MSLLYFLLETAAFSDYVWKQRRFCC